MKYKFSIFAVLLLFVFQSFGITTAEAVRRENSISIFKKASSTDHKKNTKLFLIATEETEENCDEDNDSTVEQSSFIFLQPSLAFFNFQIITPSTFFDKFYQYKAKTLSIYLKYRNLRL